MKAEVQALEENRFLNVVRSPKDAYSVPFKGVLKPKKMQMVTSSILGPDW